MKNTRRNGTKLIAIVMVMVTLFVAFGATAFATTSANAKVAEFKAEAIAEKAIAVTNSRVATTVEPVVEGATGAAEEAVAVVTVQYEAVDVEIESTDEIMAKLNVAEEIGTANTVEVASEETTGVVEETAEIVEESFTSSELVAEEATGEAVLAATANAPATNNEVITMDAANAAGSVDNVATEYAAAEAVKTVASVNAKYVGVPGVKGDAFTVVGDSTLMNGGLQQIIDADKIACYPSCDMTKGVKYFAGHHPGVMNTLAGSSKKEVDNLKVGKIVRLSNDNTYQDYKVVEVKQGKGSFDSIYFNTAGTDLWTLLTRGTQNAVVIQFCVNGVNTLHYAVAI